MTYQIPDSLIRDGARYSILTVQGTGWFSLHSFGLCCDEIGTACWRGYLCTYRLDGDRLQLDYLLVGKSWDGHYPAIGAAQPQIHERAAAAGAFYEHMRLPVPLTGRMRLGKDLQDKRLAGLGAFEAIDSQYATVVDVEFVDGVLADWIDRSAELRESRPGARSDPVSRLLRAPHPTTMGALPWLELTRCALCGVAQRVPKVGSAQPVDTTQVFDREARPRTLFGADCEPYVQACMACNHAAPQIACTPVGLREQAVSQEYRALRRTPHLPEDVNALRAAAYLLHKDGQAGRAFWHWLRAAWRCDDVLAQASLLMGIRPGRGSVKIAEPAAPLPSAGAPTITTGETQGHSATRARSVGSQPLERMHTEAVTGARLCRQMALEAANAAAAMGDTLGLAPARLCLIRAELLRRTGEFDAARTAVAAGYALQPNLDLTRALRTSEWLSERSDADTPASSRAPEECASYVAPWNAEEHEVREAPRRAKAARQLAQRQAEKRVDAERAASVTAEQASEEDLVWHPETPAGFIDACREIYSRGETLNSANVPIGRNYRWLFLRNANNRRWPADEWPLALAVAMTRTDPALRARAGTAADAWERTCANSQLVETMQQFIAGTTPLRWVVVFGF